MAPMENQPLVAQMEAGRSFHQNHFETWQTDKRCFFQKGLRLENNLSHCFATLQEAVYDQDFFMSELFLIERKESRPRCVDILESLPQSYLWSHVQKQVSE